MGIGLSTVLVRSKLHTESHICIHNRKDTSYESRNNDKQGKFEMLSPNSIPQRNI